MTVDRAAISRRRFDHEMAALSGTAYYATSGSSRVIDVSGLSAVYINVDADLALSFTGHPDNRNHDVVVTLHQITGGNHQVTVTGVIQDTPLVVDLTDDFETTFVVSSFGDGSTPRLIHGEMIRTFCWGFAGTAALTTKAVRFRVRKRMRLVGFAANADGVPVGDDLTIDLVSLLGSIYTSSATYLTLPDGSDDSGISTDHATLYLEPGTHRWIKPQIKQVGSSFEGEFVGVFMYFVEAG